MIVYFTELFSVEEGLITPKHPMLINGITLTPGVSFGQGITFGGINFSELTEDYLEIEKDENGLIVIKGPFRY